MDFTQVNAKINSVMVKRAIDWLDVQPGERSFGSFFAGLGNFTLPLAAVGAGGSVVQGDDAIG